MAELKSKIDENKKNESIIDPTANVLQLVEATIKRIDDLSKDEKEHTKELFVLNKEILNLHIMYQEKLSLAESKRIDAIRAVDVGAVAIDKERGVQQAAVLANQVSGSAENLRNLVSVTAAATATQFQQVVNPLIERIALLEKAQYEGIGKGRVTDPQMAELLAEMKSLRETRSENKGGSMTADKIIAYLIAAAGVAYAIFFKK